MSELLEAVKAASPERIVEAFKAAIHAAHTNNPSHGYHAAFAALAPLEIVPPPVEVEVAEPAESVADVPGVVA